MIFPNLKKCLKSIIMKDTKLSNISYASRTGDIEAVYSFLERGINVDFKDKYGFTPLYEAVSENHFDIVKILTDYNADTDILYEEGNDEYNVLHLAVSNKDISAKIVELLVKKVTNINQKDRPHGNTALWYACYSGYPNNYKIAELLLQNGAKIDTKNIYGKTVLDMANQRDDIPEFKKMLEKYQNKYDDI